MEVVYLYFGNNSSFRLALACWNKKDVIEGLLLDSVLDIDGPFLSVCCLSDPRIPQPYITYKERHELFPAQEVRQREARINSPVPKSERTKAHDQNERPRASKAAEV